MLKILQQIWKRRSCKWCFYLVKNTEKDIVRCKKYNWILIIDGIKEYNRELKDRARKCEFLEGEEFSVTQIKKEKFR